MSYTNKEKPKTPQDKILSIKHLKDTIQFDKKHAKDHLKVLKKKGYTDKYNKAHAKDHFKAMKGAAKALKKLQK